MDTTESAFGDDLADWESESEEAEAAAGEQPFETTLSDAPEMATTDDGLSAAAGEGTEPVAAQVASAPAEPLEISHFDLAAEISDALSLDQTVETGAAAPVADAENGDPEESLESIFTAFKRGVQRTLTAADHETHYDLGIAYREMGLLEDAMGEFQIALASPTRQLDCLHLLGLCARELKRPQDAAAFFRQALAEPELPVERRTGIGFDLGVALAENGEAAESLIVLDEVASLDPDYPGLTERIEAVRALLSRSPTAEGECTASDTTGEVFESFDDLIADAEAALATGVGDGRDAPPVAPTVPATSGHTTDEPPPTPPRGTSPRRRKISFG